MKVPASTFSKKMRDLGIGLGRATGAKSFQWYDSKQRAEFEKWWYKVKVISRGGSLNTEGNVEDDMKELLDLFKGRKVKLEVKWTFVED